MDKDLEKVFEKFQGTGTVHQIAEPIRKADGLPGISRQEPRQYFRNLYACFQKGKSGCPELGSGGRKMPFPLSLGA